MCLAWRIGLFMQPGKGTGCRVTTCSPRACHLTGAPGRPIFADISGPSLFPLSIGGYLRERELRKRKAGRRVCGKPVQARVHPGQQPTGIRFPRGSTRGTGVLQELDNVARPLGRAQGPWSIRWPPFLRLVAGQPPNRRADRGLQHVQTQQSQQGRAGPAWSHGACLQTTEGATRARSHAARWAGGRLGRLTGLTAMGTCRLGRDSATRPSQAAPPLPNVLG